MSEMSSQVKTSSTQDEDLSAIDILIELAKSKRFIFNGVMLSVFLGIMVFLTWPQIYVTKASLMPPESDGFSAMALAGQGGGLIGGLASSALGLQTPADLYAGVLQSDVVADRIIKKHGLMSVYDASTRVEARKLLADNTRITISKEGLLEIEVEDLEGARAAALANEYVAQLRQVSLEMSNASTAVKRSYFESQVHKIRVSMSDAEIALKEFQEKSGLLELTEQSKVILEKVASLQALVLAKEVEISAIRSFATERNPDLRRAQQELSSLKAQLANAELNTANQKGDIFLSISKLPSAGLEYLRRLRDVKYQEALYEAMSKYAELAKIEEGMSKITIQQIGFALPPDKSVSPKILLITSIFAFAGLLCSVVIVIAKAAFERLDGNSSISKKYGELRGHLLKW